MQSRLCGCQARCARKNQDIRRRWHGKDIGACLSARFVRRATFLFLQSARRWQLCLNLAFSCSLRIGELLGLTWDCVDISEESIAAGKAHIVVNKQLQRVNKRSMEATDSKDVLTTFPEISLQNKTVLILKKPKTRASIRKIFLPKTVAENLTKWKMEQDLLIEQLGAEYHDYNLVIAGSRGQPVESNIIRKSMRQLIEANELPQVCFHSLRHPYVKPTTKKFITFFEVFRAAS